MYKCESLFILLFIVGGLSMNIHEGKGVYSCPIEIIKGLTDKGQFQYLTGLKGPQEGTYLYTTQFLSLR